MMILRSDVCVTGADAQREPQPATGPTRVMAARTGAGRGTRTAASAAKLVDGGRRGGNSVDRPRPRRRRRWHVASTAARAAAVNGRAWPRAAFDGGAGSSRHTSGSFVGRIPHWARASCTVHVNGVRGRRSRYRAQQACRTAPVERRVVGGERRVVDLSAERRPPASPTAHALSWRVVAVSKSIATKVLMALGVIEKTLMCLVSDRPTGLGQ